MIMAIHLKPANFSFGPWTLTVTKGTIMKSDQAERLAHELQLPNLPEMVFADNRFRICHSAGFSVSFNATDALKRVNNKEDLMKVAVADEWAAARCDQHEIKEIVRPFDWTYTTDYRGTIETDEEGMDVSITPTSERIDMEKLKVREKIHFYEDVILYEDELADNGTAKLSVKVRVMPASFFVLLRFFLRVDKVVVRLNDTRYYHEAGTNFMLREYSSKESMASKIKDPYADPSVLSDSLQEVTSLYEKLTFPEPRK